MSARPRETLQTGVRRPPIEPSLSKEKTCRRGIFDNMRTAVETVFVGKHRQNKPNRIVRVTADGVQQMTYWQHTDSGHTNDMPTTIRRVRELLDESILRQLVADVPLCTPLSGRLDSSAMSGLVARFSDERIRSGARDPACLVPARNGRAALSEFRHLRFNQTSMADRLKMITASSLIIVGPYA